MVSGRSELQPPVMSTSRRETTDHLRRLPLFVFASSGHALQRRERECFVALAFCGSLHEPTEAGRRRGCGKSRKGSPRSLPERRLLHITRCLRCHFEVSHCAQTLILSPPALPTGGRLLVQPSQDPQDLGGRATEKQCPVGHCTHRAAACPVVAFINTLGSRYTRRSDFITSYAGSRMVAEHFYTIL